MILRCLDFETTGMPNADGGASICEVGWCDVDLERGSVLAPESFVVDPERDIPPEARAVHHLQTPDFEFASSQKEAFTALERMAPDYWVAHNAKFEQAFFKGEAPWICTYKVALRVWPDAPAHTNQVLRYWLNIKLNQDLAMPPHRAGPDAYVTAHILLKAYESGSASIEDMARWSDGPPLLPKVTFGKHRGSRWEDVPLDYLDWIVNKSDMDNDIKANAKHHMKKARNA